MCHVIEVEDEADVASILGVIFMSTMFVGIICFQTVIPAGSKERIVFYREQASCTHTHAHTPVPYEGIGIFELEASAINIEKWPRVWEGKNDRAEGDDAGEST